MAEWLKTSTFPPLVVGSSPGDLTLNKKTTHEVEAIWRRTLETYPRTGPVIGRELLEPRQGRVRARLKALDVSNVD